MYAVLVEEMKKQARAQAKKNVRAKTVRRMAQGMTLARSAPTAAPVVARANGDGRHKMEEPLATSPLFDLPVPIDKPIKQKPEVTVEAEPQPTSDDQPLNKIREILFGTQMSNVDQRLAAIQDELAELRGTVQALADKLEETRESGEQKLEHARRGLRMSITNAQMQLKEIAQKVDNEMVDRAALADMLTQLAVSIKQDAHD